MAYDIKTLFSAVSTAADVYSDWVDTLGAQAAIIHLDLANNSSPVGAFRVEYSNDLATIESERVRWVGAASDGTQGKKTVSGAASTAKKVEITADIPSEAIAGTGLAVTGANGTIIALEFPARFIRVWYDVTSGGAVSSLYGWVNLAKS